MTRNNKTRTTVNIYGRSYTIVGSESTSHVHHVADLVDEKMQEFHKMNKSLDTANLAVLTAVNTMNDYLKLKEEVEVLHTLLEEKEE